MGEHSYQQAVSGLNEIRSRQVPWASVVTGDLSGPGLVRILPAPPHTYHRGKTLLKELGHLGAIQVVDELLLILTSYSLPSTPTAWHPRAGLTSVWGSSAGEGTLCQVPTVFAPCETGRLERAERCLFHQS